MIFTLFACMVIKNWGFVGLFFFLFVYIPHWATHWITFSDFFFILAYADVDFIFSYTHFESIFAKNTVYKSREKLKSFFNLHFTLNLKKTNLLLLCLVLRRRMQLIWIAIIPVPSRLFMLGFRRCFLSVHSTDLCSCLITMIFSCLLSLSFSVTEQMRTIIAWS